MTIEARAERIAVECIATHAGAFYVCATRIQQHRVMEAASAQIVIHLKAMLAEHHVKFE